MAKILRSNIPYKQPSSENLIEFIKNGLVKNSVHTLLIDSTSGRSWTGKEIEISISVVAKFLLEECGLKKGDVCSIYSEENDHIALIMLSIICAGGIVNFLTDKSSAREVHDTASVMNSRFLITRQELLKKIRPNLEDLEDKLQMVCYDACPTRDCKSMEICLDKNIAVQKQGVLLDNLLETIQIDPEIDRAIIQFSSGTTGKPKPIPRTHKNLCHLVASVDHEELMDLRPGVVITGSLPITHRPGLWALLACVNGGSTFVVWSNLSDVKDALATIERYKVTIFSSSLPFLSMLGNTGILLKEQYNTSSLKHIITSGAKIVNPKLPESLIKEFNLDSLRQCFGMTESGWVFLIEQSLAKGNYLSVGHVVPGMEAIVIDRETSQRLKANERGEVALRGPQVFPGYLTADANDVLNRSDFTEDGWFKIGDQAYYDENDLVFIEGRYKESMMFENNSLHFPTEIEAVITEHPSVEGACVVKIGQVTKDYPYDIARAYVTLRHPSESIEEDLVKFVLERSPSVVLGGGVKVLDKFPRLQNGKVDKQTLSSLSKL